MTIPTQHNANLSENSYRLDHKVGYHPPGNREKINARCGVGGVALTRRLTVPGICG